MGLRDGICRTTPYGQNRIRQHTENLRENYERRKTLLKEVGLWRWTKEG